MPMQSWTYKLPKKGNSEAEYEDASACDAAAMCCAIADGATESSFAGSWAQLLVEDFAACPQTDPPKWADRLPPLQQRWQREISAGALPWYAEAKLEMGAAATFLGLTFSCHRGQRRSWQALAVGDSCLFQVRRERLLVKFPMKRSEDFGSTPVLINSRLPTGPLRRCKTCQTKKGGWQSGDTFWLMTDALAQWFLRRCEEGKHPWEDMQHLLEAADGEQAFAEWITELREQNQLRNDDTTLVIVRAS